MKNPLLGFEESMLGAVLSVFATTAFSFAYSDLIAVPWPIEMQLYRWVGLAATVIPTLSVGLAVCLPMSFLAGWLYSRRARHYALMVCAPVRLLSMAGWTLKSPVAFATTLILLLLIMVGARLGASIEHRYRVPALHWASHPSYRRRVAYVFVDVALPLLFIANAAIWSNLLRGMGRSAGYPWHMFAFFGIVLGCLVATRYDMHRRDARAMRAEGVVAPDGPNVSGAGQSLGKT
jgi:hypothetical protein